MPGPSKRTVLPFMFATQRQSRLELEMAGLCEVYLDEMYQLADVETPEEQVADELYRIHYATRRKANEERRASYYERPARVPNTTWT